MNINLEDSVGRRNLWWEGSVFSDFSVFAKLGEPHFEDILVLGCNLLNIVC